MHLAKKFIKRLHYSIQFNNYNQWRARCVAYLILR